MIVGVLSELARRPVRELGEHAAPLPTDAISENATAVPDPSATLQYCETSTDGTVRPLTEDEVEFAREFFAGAEVGERYVLQTALGRGGMGRVFLARDPLLDRLVAIKVVARKSNQPAALADSLAKEARLGATLNHPGIATVFDVGVHADRLYTVFEYVEGLTLREVIHRRQKMPLAEVCQIITSLSRALDYAHSNGIIHRDLKPENVAVAKSGELKVLDLGTGARHTTRLQLKFVFRDAGLRGARTGGMRSH